MSAAAVLPMASAAGITQFERERLARIAMIQAEMHKIMQGVDTSLLVKQPRWGAAAQVHLQQKYATCVGIAQGRRQLH